MDLEFSQIPAIVSALKAGQTLLYLTDTVWGIGCDATNAAAVSRIYQIKKRADAKALITLVSDVKQLKSHVEKLPALALELLQQPTDRPTTIIYSKAKNLAPNVTATDGSIAIRIPQSNDFLIQLLKAFGRPLVSTSANISGQSTPLSFEMVSEVIKKEIDVIVSTKDAKATQNKQPSRILKISEKGDLMIIRD